MAHMDKVREHLGRVAESHREVHRNRLREAAIARAEYDAEHPPEVPATGLQADQSAGDGLAEA